MTCCPLFPQRGRAMVLDGNIDPRGSIAGFGRSGVALDSALAFVRSVSPPVYASIRATLAHLDASPIDVGKGLRYMRWDYVAEGVFGGVVTAEYLMGCAGLTIAPDPVPTMRSAANRARVAHLPVVISNATNDGSTPMVWAQHMRRSFARGVLIRYSSGQHVLWSMTPSTCVNVRITRMRAGIALPAARDPPGLLTLATRLGTVPS